MIGTKSIDSTHVKVRDGQQVTANHVLEYLFRQLVNYKKIEQVVGAAVADRSRRHCKVIGIDPHF